MMAAAGWALETREIGVISVRHLNMRLGAGMGYPVIKVLEKDTQVPCVVSCRRLAAGDA